MQQSHRLWSFVLFWNRRKTKIVTFAVLQRILRVVCEFFLQWKQQRKKTTILVVFVAQPDIGVCMISPRCVRLTSAWSNILRRHRCRRHVSFIYLFFTFFLFQSSETIEFFCAQSNCRQLLSRFFAFISRGIRRFCFAPTRIAFYFTTSVLRCWMWFLCVSCRGWFAFFLRLHSASEKKRNKERESN